ncbi:TetR/AcrR family transcriptional regulator [Nocardioides stalactiti]|uniref:TetR/AcrR family transcriptional regulator n=1 Tax=Nocardioides stalactiti TaxID=2755356 RepID=UPI001C7F69D8|nr:TetR/AcrR family transcriptional regulator [Nocardioides stalactiti]
MRKQPRQERSRQMVERIVAAGREVLVERGYDGFSTNHVATAAGISPGSLYQYFPNKAAILDEVVDRYVAESAEQVTSAMSDRITALGPDLVRDVADALVAVLEADRALLRVVAEELPLARSRARLTALERQVREVSTAYLAARPDLHRRPPAAAAWVMVLAIENLAVRWVLDQPAAVSRDQLLDETVALVSGYLVS